MLLLLLSCVAHASGSLAVTSVTAGALSQSSSVMPTGQNRELETLVAYGRVLVPIDRVASLSGDSRLTEPRDRFVYKHVGASGAFTGSGASSAGVTKCELYGSV